MGDFGWENWSQFGKVDVAVTGGQNSPSLTTTTNYNDVYHVAIGSQYRLNPEWLLNGGFAYDSVIPAILRQKITGWCSRGLEDS